MAQENTLLGKVKKFLEDRQEGGAWRAAAVAEALGEADVDKISTALSHLFKEGWLSRCDILIPNSRKKGYEYRANSVRHVEIKPLQPRKDTIVPRAKVGDTSIYKQPPKFVEAIPPTQCVGDQAAPLASSAQPGTTPASEKAGSSGPARDTSAPAVNLPKPLGLAPAEFSMQHCGTLDIYAGASGLVLKAPDVVKLFKFLESTRQVWAV